MYGSYGSFDNAFSGLVCVVAKHGILLNILSENIIGVSKTGRECNRWVEAVNHSTERHGLQYGHMRFCILSGT